MTRLPTPRAALYAWHTNAMLGILGDDHPHIGEEPQCGWFKRRLVKGGVYVPARIWLYQPTDPETGELVADELLQCEVDGRYADPHREWSWLCGKPITEAEFKYLTALRTYADGHAQSEPYASPNQPVNWLAVPTPAFKSKEHTP